MATNLSEFAPDLTNELVNFVDVIAPGIGNTVSGSTALRIAFLEWLSATDSDKESLYRTLRDYYDGEHLYLLNDRMREFLELDANIKFDLNYLPIPVDVLNERLRVKGFDTDEAVQGGDEGIFWQWWKDNRMDAYQSDVHHAMLRDGDTFVLVGWDDAEDMPVFTHETAYDGTNGVIIRYEEERRNRMRFARKTWRIESGPGAGSVQRMNIYTPSVIFKYITGTRGWDRFIDTNADGNDQPWPLPWVDSDGAPLGIPVVHFRNNAGGYDFGKSEIKDLIPAQDALNKAVIDEIAGADIEGFGLITLTGGKAPPDDVQLGPRRILYANLGTWGSIPAGNLSGLSNLVTAYITRMAQMSRIPLSYFQVTGAIASADTQRADDTGLVSKAESRGVTAGNSWENVMTISRRLANAFGSTSYDEDVEINTIWDSFARVDKHAMGERKAAILTALVNAGASLQGAADVAGYTEEEQEKLAPREEVTGIEQ